MVLNEIILKTKNINISGVFSIKCDKDSSCGCKPICTLSQSSQIMSGLCSDTSNSRGGNQKVISYSLFGEELLFAGRFEMNLAAVKKYYPGYIMRIYHNYTQNSVMMKKLCDNFCQESILDLCDIKSDLIKTSFSHELTNISARMWRFLPMADPLVSEWHSRDIDSHIIQREIDAVDEWKRLNGVYHVLRDHPAHTAEILAGMFGMKLTVENREEMSRVLDDMFKDGIGMFNKSLDQNMLSKHLYPVISKPDAKTVVHDSYTCEYYDIPQNKPFPTKRNTTDDFKNGPYNFVATIDGVISIPTFKECPKSCRPKEHQDWILC